jgi:hypothetical protein
VKPPLRFFHSSSASFFAGSVVLAVAGCVTDHNQLAAQPPSPDDASAGGAGGRRARADAAAGGTDAADPEIIQPPLVRSITLVHGVIDAPWIAFCVAAVQGGKAAVPGPPIPLEYGHSAALASIDGVDFAVDGVLPYVVAATSADEVKGLDCVEMIALAAKLAEPPGAVGSGAPDASPPAGAAGSDGGSRDATVAVDAAKPQADAGVAHDAGADASDGADAGDARAPAVPVPAVRALPLPIIPPGTFVEMRGYLVVAGGCMGGPGVTDEKERDICGDLYSQSTPTLTETVVAPKSAAPIHRVALSVLGGTPAIPQADLGIDPATHGDRLTVAQKVTPGALRPSSPYTGATASEIGATSAEGALLLFTSGSSAPSYQKPWQPTLEAGGIEELADGTAYTLIIVGPPPGFAFGNGNAKARWWNDPLVTIVRNR